MGIFKNMTESLFKETEDDKTIYYGKGLLRRAYIITDAKTKERLYTFHQRVNRYVLPLGIVYAMLLGLGGAPLIGMLPIFIVAIILHFRHKSLVKNLPIYDQKLTPKEAKNNIASVFPKPFLIFMIINGFLGILTALFLPTILDKEVNEIASLMIIFFVMGMFLLGTGWYLYKEKQNTLK